MPIFWALHFWCSFLFTATPLNSIGRSGQREPHGSADTLHVGGHPCGQRAAPTQTGIARTRALPGREYPARSLPVTSAPSAAARSGTPSAVRFSASNGGHRPQANRALCPRSGLPEAIRSLMNGIQSRPSIRAIRSIADSNSGRSSSTTLQITAKSILIKS